MSHARPNILIAGCGYVGERLALRLCAQYDITALVRSPQKGARLAALGLEVVTIDLDRVRAGASLPERLDQEAIIYLTPPPEVGESDLRLDRFLQLATVPPKAFVYVSTTGVYGDTAGSLVDESSPVQPRTDRARRRVSAEEMTRVWCSERRVRRIVLRVPAIYGPARLPLERLQRREPVVREREAGLSNRIHVDDLVEACAQAVTNVEARGVYNICDGTPLNSTAFMNRVAALAGLPSPPQVSLDEAQLTFSVERLSFLNESRRVSNDRMLRHLKMQPRYADPDEGIRASLREQGHRSSATDNRPADASPDATHRK